MIDLSAEYPGQVDTGIPGYPYGKPRNVTTPGAGDGTPWEEQCTSDIFGFLQALLVSANLTPSGVPENATTSQAREALKALTRRNGVTALLSGTPGVGDAFDLDAELETPDSGFTYGSGGGADFILAPETGLYSVSLNMKVLTSSTIDAVEVRLNATMGTQHLKVGGTRYNVNPLTPIYLSGSRIMQLGPVQPIGVYVEAAGAGTISVIEGRLSIAKVSAAPAGGEAGW